MVPGARDLGPGDRRDHAGPERSHQSEDGPALPPVADEDAVCARKRERDHEQQEDLEEVGQRVWVLERVRGVGVEVAAAVRAEFLDGLLRRGETAGDPCWPPETVTIVVGRREFWTTPPSNSTSAATRANGRSTRMRVRVRSTQKLPNVVAFERPGHARARWRPRGPRPGTRSSAPPPERLDQGRGARLARVGLPVRVRDEGDRGTHCGVPVHRRVTSERENPLRGSGCPAGGRP